MIYIFLAAIIWGCSFPVITYALGDISPILFVFLRFILSFVLLIPFLNSTKDIRSIFRMDIVLIALLPALAYILQFKAQELTSASKTSIFVNLTPVFIAILNPLLLKTSLSRYQIFALILAISGVIITSTNLEFSEITAVTIGDGLNLTVSLLWSFFIIYSKNIIEKYGELSFNLAIYFWISLTALVFLPMEEVRFSLHAIPSILFLAIFATIAAFFFYTKGIKSVSAFSTSIVFLGEIIVAGGISYFFLGERFTLIETIGTILIVCGVLTVVRDERVSN
jgi:drug/metabolite transporter (DMT)-like permease